MHPIQVSALVMTVGLPLGLFVAGRWARSLTFERRTRRSLALLLLIFELANIAGKFADGSASFTEALPMHLCDWALVAVGFGLWSRSQLGFELGYFWALGGTFQALLTPAISFSEPWWRLLVFFYSHALIVVGVLHLLLGERMRLQPRSLLRLVLWSEIYLAVTLTVNALVNGNYGFLAHPPNQSTLLDHFSQTPWLYVAEINLAAFTFFAVLYLPWMIRDLVHWRTRPISSVQNLS